ncbi:MAG TPA: hypothetical protein VF765_14050 [Polyangiaceae bacterium]
MVAATNLDWIDDGWDPAEMPAVSFAIEPRRATSARLSRAEGVVKHVDEERLHIGTPGFRNEHAQLEYHLPASLDLRPLVGRRVHVEIAQGRTLTIWGDTGRLWLVAHRGRDAFWQSVGGFDLCVSISKEAEEMVVVGPGGQSHILRCGESARITCGSRSWIVELVAYYEPGEGAYFIADASLWH